MLVLSIVACNLILGGVVCFVLKSPTNCLFGLSCVLGYCAFVDAEHALDPSLAEAIGVDTSNLLLSQPDSAEQALSLVDTLIRSGSVDVVVVDSVRT
jgi:RecA/RadA recombinase